jgi:hypothetical protein
LNRGTDYVNEMSDRLSTFARALRLPVVALAAMLALAVAAPGFASKVAPPRAARDLAQTYFAGSFTRAEVVTVGGRYEHDWRVDEGRVVAVRQNAIDIVERDGTRQTITIGAQTVVSGVGRPFAPGSVTRGTRVVTLRDGNGPAVQVRPSAWGRILGTNLLGGTLVRAEVLNYQAKTLHDYRIDEGRITAVKPTSITLLERDGTRQSIAVTSTSTVMQNGQPADPSMVVKGLSALTIREGSGPAEQIWLAPAGAVVVGR